MALGAAALNEERYDEAVGWWAECARATPGFGAMTIGHAIMLALAGRMEEAGPVFARGLELEPQLRVRGLRELGFVPALTEKIVRGARLLGLPE